MVEEALAAQREAPKGDALWVVYDRESAIRYPDTLHAEARQKAGDKVHIAISNVCFEVWLLLHFQQHAAAYNSCEDLLKRSALKKKHIKNYDKANRREYSDAEIASARTNAERMNAQTEAAANPGWKYPHQWNPYTSVHKLLDAIDSFSKQHIRAVR